MYDQVVMPECQIALWDALGRNDRVDFPMAHYSGGLIAKKVMRDVAAIVGGAA